MARKIAAVLFLLGVLLIITAPTAKADHNVYLPLTPNTPIMQTVKATQEYTWCVNARGLQYPGFVGQVREVADAYTVRTGIRHREVAYGAACQVRHDMLDNHPCSGCAAWVYYANNPVTIEYKTSAGYVLWQTTIGHELGHALLGLHEQYRDSGGVIQCTGRTDTVMDCGSGVRYPTALDVDRGCALYQTAWCGRDGTLQCTGQGDPYWNPCTSRWVFADGQEYEPRTGIWYLKGKPEWTACNADGLRWNLQLLFWAPPGSSFFAPSRGYWSTAGAC